MKQFKYFALTILLFVACSGLQAQTTAEILDNIETAAAFVEPEEIIKQVIVVLTEEDHQLVNSSTVEMKHRVTDEAYNRLLRSLSDNYEPGWQIIDYGPVGDNPRVVQHVESGVTIRIAYAPRGEVHDYKLSWKVIAIPNF